MYSLEVSRKITKELLLSGPYTQETYFEHYLGIPVKKNLFVSPTIIRKDQKPTCSFYKNKQGVLKYKDFAGPTFDFVGAVMYIFNCSYYEALRIIANDFNFIKSDIPKNLRKIEYTGYELKETERAKIQVEIQEFTDKELIWWESFGISKKTLTKFKVFSIKNVFLNGFYFTSSTEKSPIFGFYNGTAVDNTEFWRLYMPSKLKYRFLSNWASSMIQGAKQLPKESSSVFITKSLKDVMGFFEFGFTSIAPNSENILISQNQFTRLKLRYDNLYVFFDNDLAGVKGANKYRKKYSINCIFIKRKYAKDFTDLYKSISRAQFWIIIDELNYILDNPDIKQTKHFYIF
jgi:hypothetical protein